MNKKFYFKLILTYSIIHTILMYVILIFSSWTDNIFYDEAAFSFVETFKRYLVSLFFAIVAISIITIKTLSPLRNIVEMKDKGIIPPASLYKKARKINFKIAFWCIFLASFFYLLGVVVANLTYLEITNPLDTALLYLTRISVGFLEGLLFYLATLKYIEPYLAYLEIHKIDYQKGERTFSLRQRFTLIIITMLLFFSLLIGHNIYRSFLQSNEYIENKISLDETAAFMTIKKKELDKAKEKYFNVVEDKILVFLPLSCIVVFVLGISIVIYFLGTFSKTLSNVNNRVKDLSLGKLNLNDRLNIINFDEFGVLSESINKLMDSLLDIIERMAIASDKVNTHSNRINNSIEITSSAVKQITSSIDNIQEDAELQINTIEKTNSSFQNLVSSMNDINTTLEAQSSAVEQSASSINEMMENINSITGTTSKANELANTLYEVADKGSKAIFQSEEAINEIDESSKQVVEIVTLISNIAEQTNLLAMNAAIEAAHAGESGKGFAVVADEVRKLAEDSANSAKEIVTHINTMTEKVERGVELSNTARISLEQILKDIKETTKLINEISQSMSEQSSGTTEILKAINSLVTTTQETRSSIKQQSDNNSQIKRALDNIVELSNKTKNVINEHRTSSEEIVKVVEELKSISDESMPIIKQLKETSEKYYSQTEETTEIGITTQKK